MRLFTNPDIRLKASNNDLLDKASFVTSPNGNSRIDRLMFNRSPFLNEPVITKISHFCDKATDDSAMVQDFASTSFDPKSGEPITYHSSIIGGLGVRPSSLVPENLLDHNARPYNKDRGHYPLIYRDNLTAHQFVEADIYNNKASLFDVEHMEDILNMSFESINGLLILLTGIVNNAYPIEFQFEINSKQGLRQLSNRINYIKDTNIMDMTKKQMQKYFKTLTRAFRIFKRDCEQSDNHIVIFVYVYSFGVYVTIFNADYPQHKIHRKYNLSDHQRLIITTQALSTSGYDESDYGEEFLYSGFPSLAHQLPLFEFERKEFFDSCVGNYYSANYPSKI